MDIEIKAESMAALPGYAAVPIAFEVAEVFDVTAAPGDDMEFRLVARPLTAPYTKDYDAIDGEGPTQWAKRFDVSKWGFLGAYAAGQRVGAAAVAHNTPALDMLEGRLELAVLWDIRVAPAVRRRGVGAALFRKVVRWASARGCRQLKIETQNINVAACEFYAQQGCILRAVQRGVYLRLPDEVQLLWYLDLAHEAAAG